MASRGSIPVHFSNLISCEIAFVKWDLVQRKSPGRGQLVQAAGARRLRAIAAGLNERRIRTPRGDAIR
jgi:hypothetical protein